MWTNERMKMSQVIVQTGTQTRTPSVSVNKNKMNFYTGRWFRFGKAMPVVVVGGEEESWVMQTPHLHMHMNIHIMTTKDETKLNQQMPVHSLHYLHEHFLFLNFSFSLSNVYDV